MKKNSRAIFARLFLLTAFSILLVVFSPTTVGAETSLLKVVPTGAAPKLDHFSISMGDNGKGTVSVQIQSVGDKASSIASCVFTTTRPATNVELSISGPDTTHPDMRFCEGDVDFGNIAPYLPAATVMVTNNLGLSASATTPTNETSLPVINSVALNDTQENEITISHNYDGSIHVNLSITDSTGNKDCDVSLSKQSANVEDITNYYESCSFDLTNITGGFTASVTATNLLGVKSKPYTFTVTQEASAPVAAPVETPSTRPPHLIADYSVTQGKVVVPEAIRPDTNQTQNLNRAAMSFWLGIVLLVASVVYCVFLIWKKRKKQYWPHYLVTSLVFVVGIASITYTQLSLGMSKPQFIRHATFNTTTIPLKKSVATELTNTQGANSFKKTDASKPTVGVDPKTQTSSNTPDGVKPLAKFPEYALHFAQFVGNVDSSQTALMLKTKVAESPDAPIWGAESAVTQDTDYVKSFQLTSSGEVPGDLTVEVSTFPFPGQNCTASTAIYSTTISAKEKETLFNLDFKKIIPAAYLNGKQTGTLPFNVRVIKKGSKENCNDLISNAVSTSAVFILTSQTVTYPDGAAKNALYTTGVGQRTGGEFPNTEDVTFLNWHLENQDYRFVMDEGSAAGYPSYGRWQVALSPFDDAQCLGPENQIAYADIDLTDKQPRSLAFDIDFAKIAINKPTSKGTKSNFEETKPATWKNIPLNWVVKTSPNAQQTTLEEQLAKSKDPVAYYVRFVALNAGAGTCNTSFKPTNTVTITYGEQKESKPVYIPTTVQHPVTVDASIALSNVKYTPPRQDIDQFNPEGHYIWVRDFPDAGGAIPVVWHKGDKFYVPAVQPQEEKSFLDSVGDFVSSIGDFISSVADLVDSVANAYNGIKSFAVDTIASGLNSVGVPCDSTCKAGLSAGISIAQAAIGVPPSLPNFDQLMDGGIDYIAAAAADQVADGAGDIVSAATEQATKAGLQEMKKKLQESRDQANNSPDSSPTAPDPDYMYKPGSISVTVKNFGNTPARGNLVIHFHDTNSMAGLDLKDRELFKPVSLSVPTLAAGESMNIPIQLEENYDDYRSYEGDVPPGYTCSSKSGSCAGIVSDPAYALGQRKNRWFKVYNDMQITMTVFAGAPIKLPQGFKPSDIGLDAAGWVLKPGSSGGATQAWFDEPNNIIHVFSAKPQGGQSLNLTFSPHTAYSN